ncbi:MAG: LiaF transmembrane domain-containing protein, partial [Gammaproteobacteria bacterium]
FHAFAQVRDVGADRVGFEHGGQSLRKDANGSKAAVVPHASMAAADSCHWRNGANWHNLSMSEQEAAVMTTNPANNSRRHVEWRILPALVIVAVGVLFLLNNLGYRLDFLFHGNWWALLILIGAIPPLTRAYEVYRARGRLDAEAGYSLLAASAVVLVAVMFLAGLDWGTWWPLFVILGGLFTLVRRPYHHRHYRDDPDWQHGTDEDATFKH